MPAGLACSTYACADSSWPRTAVDVTSVTLRLSCPASFSSAFARSGSYTRCGRAGVVGRPARAPDVICDEAETAIDELDHRFAIDGELESGDYSRIR